MNGSDSQHASGKRQSAENSPKAAAQSATLLRILGRSGTVLDALIVFTAIVLAFHVEWRTPLAGAPWLWTKGEFSNTTAWKLVSALGGFVVVLLWTSSHHIDSVSRQRTSLEEQKLNLKDCAISAVVLLSWLYITGAEAVPSSFILLLISFVALGLSLRRLIYRVLPMQPKGPRNVLIIGADSTAVALREQMRNDPELGYTFKGFVKLSNSDPDSIDYPGEVIGTIDDLPEHVFKYSVNEVFLTPSCNKEITAKLVNQARDLGINSRMVLGHVRVGVDLKNDSKPV